MRPESLHSALRGPRAGNSLLRPAGRHGRNRGRAADAPPGTTHGLRHPQPAQSDLLDFGGRHRRCACSLCFGARQRLRAPVRRKQRNPPCPARARRLRGTAVHLAGRPGLLRRRSRGSRRGPVLCAPTGLASGRRGRPARCAAAPRPCLGTRGLFPGGLLLRQGYHPRCALSACQRRV